MLTGLSPLFSRATTPLFQFARMISPLSWMPTAVMVLGVGDAPRYFLLAFAAVWLILLNTAAGVSQLDPNWLPFGRSLSATRAETLLKVILPGITAHILTGVRLAIGIIWIVLVPAEMLGVSEGLGYFIRRPRPAGLFRPDGGDPGDRLPRLPARPRRPQPAPALAARLTTRASHGCMA